MKSQKLKKENTETKNIKRAIAIKNALLENGITQKELAKKLNMHEGSITKFVYGQRKSKRFDKYIKENYSVKL